MLKHDNEIDLADLIHSYLWDCCDDAAMAALESISERVFEDFEQRVRKELERRGINSYFHDGDEQK